MYYSYDSNIKSSRSTDTSDSAIAAIVIQEALHSRPMNQQTYNMAVPKHQPAPVLTAQEPSGSHVRRLDGHRDAPSNAGAGTQGAPQSVLRAPRGTKRTFDEATEHASTVTKPNHERRKRPKLQ